MKNVLKYIVHSLLLFLIETLICIFLYEISIPITYKNVNLSHIEKAFLDGLELNLVRFVLYYWIYIILFIPLMKHSVWNKRTLQTAVINCGLYILISTLYAFLIIPDSKEYLKADFFYFLIFATFISPFILKKIPYTNKVIKKE